MRLLLALSAAALMALASPAQAIEKIPPEAKAVEIIQGYESGKITLPMTLSRFLTDWLRNHIKKSDLEMIKHVQKAGVSA